MNKDLKDTQEKQTINGEEKKYVDGICVNCGSRLAIPEEVAKKLIEEGRVATS